MKVGADHLLWNYYYSTDNISPVNKIPPKTSVHNFFQSFFLRLYRCLKSFCQTFTYSHLDVNKKYRYIWTMVHLRIILKLSNMAKLDLKKATKLWLKLMALCYILVVLLSLTSCSSTRQCKKLPTYGWYK